MNFKTSGSLIAAAAACVMLSVPASAAMPVSGASVPALDSAIIQVAKKKKMTRRQEFDKSVESGTVPSRYRNSVPKEYQQYVPFAKQ